MNELTKNCYYHIFELSKYQGKIDAILQNISGSLSHQSRGCFSAVPRFPPVDHSNQLNVSGEGGGGWDCVEPVGAAGVSPLTAGFSS